MSTGLVLEGGAMRGMYTAGVLDIFFDYQIPVDGIIGVSAGAVFGINYPSRQRGRVIRSSRHIPIKRVEKNPEKLQEMYDLGIEDCKNVISDLKTYLEV